MSQLEHGARLLARAVEEAYGIGQTDYSLEPLARMDEVGKAGRIKANDAVVFCCRRGEREVELTEAFTEPGFSGFSREMLPGLDFVILTLYHEKFAHLPVAFMPSKVKDTLAETVSAAGLSQLHCSESEKFAHVTYFFNGGVNLPFPGEADLCEPSIRGIPFDKKPELSLAGVADKVLAGIRAGHDFIVTNFANGDVIGHTTSEEAKIACVAHVSRHLGQVTTQAAKAGYLIAVTADHGNIEILRTPEGKPHVAHTCSPVPFVLVSPGGEFTLQDGILADVAPTVLQMMGIPQPPAMSGRSLIQGEPPSGKVLLIILDGWGLGSGDDNDAIFLGSTPEWDSLLRDHPHCRLEASGAAAGLQASKAGNSEAGHLNLGAGRVVLQDDVRLDAAMQDGTFTRNEIFIRTIDGAKRRGAALHLISYLSHKSSHGAIDYPLALTGLARERGLEAIYLHIIFDGRSTAPGSAPELLEELENALAALGAGQVVDGVGRGIALDRDGNYGKVKRAYDMMVHGEGKPYGDK
ncbi:MAG: phosphoglycerate mutase (2,3-diphosphoglycerate-independent) [Christensenellales bacterium]